MSDILRIAVKTVVFSLLFIFFIIPLILTSIYVVCNIGWEPPNPPRCQLVGRAAEALFLLPFFAIHPVSEFMCNLLDAVSQATSPKCAPAGSVVETYATGTVYGPCDYKGNLQVSSCIVKGVEGSACVASDGRYAVFLASVPEPSEPRGCGARTLAIGLQPIIVVVDLRTGDAALLHFWFHVNNTAQFVNYSQPPPWYDPATLPATLSRFVVFGEDGVYLRNATEPFALVILRDFYAARVSVDKSALTVSGPVERASGVFVKVK
ncbi:hypothetical protein [Pyrobaculum aerophilum]|uniref:Uncharacterized protein n=1 Tax=Pyrobaculum aerophilum TaxID=13773 RepID=A0A371QX14_9CREN|nr:hypothetical protein [Pyrobaculum aerophilum]RFA94962.1 hypothetical protein CGL51_08725 [Pyrobaculum aerophilum]RFA96283.1 hypothetical protein CGL52_11135 [Pyrobaculum aerophilum]